MQLEECTVTIEKLSKGGSGLARLDGFVIFVPLSAVGDKLRIQIIEKKKNYGFAKIIEILKPGPSRIQPKCSVYGLCGGCNWQHLSYDEQLQQKEVIVREQLSAVADEKTTWFSIQRSSQNWRYRNRIQLKFQKPDLGFYKRESHEIVSIEDCPVVEEQLASEIIKIKTKLLPSSDRMDKIEAFLSIDGGVETQFGDDPFKKTAFSQVNRFVNEMLIEKIIAWAKERNFSVLYDLYSGSGNFSFPFIKEFSKIKILSVEFSEEAVQQAMNEIKKKNLSTKRIQFYQADVDLFLKRVLPEKESLEKGILVILDPPRTGCESSVIRTLSEWVYSRILYVSCDPASLGRDLKLLKLLNSRWKLKKVQPFDMFPQTDHVETLVELSTDPN